LAVGLAGHLFSRLNLMKRGLFFMGGLLLLTPYLLWEGIGFVACLLLALFELWKWRTHA